MKKIATLILLILICVSTSVSAHPGRLDANDGHYNRKTGEYHYHNGSHSTSDNSSNSSAEVKYDNVVFEDKVSGIKFLVPENWAQEIIANDTENFKVQFSTPDKKLSIFYHQTPFAFEAPQKQEIADAFDVYIRDIVIRRYNDIDFFSFSSTQDGMSFYYVLTYIDGFMISFLQYPDNNRLSSELHTLLSSFVLSNSIIAQSEEATLIAKTDSDNSIVATSNKKSKTTTFLLFADIFTYILYGLFIVPIAIYYGLPFLCWLVPLIYKRFFQKHLPYYNFMEYEQAIKQLQHCKEYIKTATETINDFYSKGSSQNQKGNNSSELVFKWNPTPSDIKWLQSECSIHQNKLTFFKKNLIHYHQKCNSSYMLFLLKFNHKYDLKLKELNSVYSTLV